MKPRFTTEIFVEKAKAIYGDRYLYHKTNYIHNKTPVTITCPLHGDFDRRPIVFLGGRFCFECRAEEERQTIEKDFIEKSNLTHNNLYSYENSFYKNAVEKITITCKIHGDFEQLPLSHIHGNGCPQCDLNKRFPNRVIDTETFIQRSHKIHECFYDYSLVSFSSYQEYVDIICPDHGNFKQKAGVHLSARGCKKCRKIPDKTGKRKSNQVFINEAKEKHQNFYSYDKTEYVKSTAAVIITCPVHGDFKQSANRHLAGGICQQCAIDKGWPNRIRDTNDFIFRAKEINGNSYDYSLSEYAGSNKKIKIICKIHGVFEQMPFAHLRGQKCLKCSIDDSYKTNDQFIEEAKDRHYNFYSYENTKYKSCCEKVEINCPQHGSFYQTPVDHLLGRGCPLCSSSRGERKVAGLLTKYGIDFIPEHKFIDCLSPRGYYLFFDFYISSLNLCIEYDGLQHEQPIDFFGGEEAFAYRTKCDELKNLYCSNNNIKLIRILHSEKDIESIFKIEGIIPDYKII